MESYILALFFMSLLGMCSATSENNIALHEDLANIRRRVEERLLAEMNSDWGWDHGSTPFVASALALSDDRFFVCGNITGHLIKKQLQLELAELLLRRKKAAISGGKLAVFINALKATCQDPHDFFNTNLVSMMRHKRVVSEYEKALRLLALCNAGHRLSKEDINCLSDLFQPHPESVHNGLDTQAMAALATACAHKNHQTTFSHTLLKDALLLFKHFQKDDGSFGNLFTTSLVAQVFIAAGEHKEDGNLHFKKALDYIRTHYDDHSDSGSAVISNHFVLPVLNLKSHAQLRHTVCSCLTENDGLETTDNAENDLWSFAHSDYEDSSELSSDAKNSDVIPRIAVTFSLWTDHERDVGNISTVVFIDEGETFLDLMEKAALADERYKFTVQNTTFGPHVISVGGIKNDVNTYWLLYKLYSDTRLQILDKGVAELKPEDGEHFVFMYKALT